MKQEPLVSVITPCYNGESYMCPMLDSLLEQTYTNVEFFFVNDGSTDCTEEIFKGYKLKFEDKGWKVFYHKQTNGGVARAINFGLAHFTGKYLTWPDSDDILYPNCLKRKVEYMEDHPSCSLLFNPVDCCAENELNVKYIPLKFTLPQKDETFFEKLLFQRGVIYCPISSFARSADFIKSVPSRHIYDACKGGQNWQMLLPLAYKHNVNYLNEILACYVNREASHSHSKRTNEIIRQNHYEDILLHSVLSITEMPENEKKYYTYKIKKIYVKKRFKLLIKLICVAMGDVFFSYLKRIFK